MSGGLQRWTGSPRTGATGTRAPTLTAPLPDERTRRPYGPAWPVGRSLELKAGPVVQLSGDGYGIPCDAAAPAMTWIAAPSRARHSA